MTGDPSGADPKPRKPIRRDMRKFVQCEHEGWSTRSFRRCELEVGHRGPHGCAQKGDEWITID
jgi:hypothetical protein